jgi:hypothetical protein
MLRNQATLVGAVIGLGASVGYKCLPPEMKKRVTHAMCEIGPVAITAFLGALACRASHLVFCKD